LHKYINLKEYKQGKSHFFLSLFPEKETTPPNASGGATFRVPFLVRAACGKPSA
jgi:hypothetical protein